MLHDILLILFGLIIGFVIGFIVTRKMVQNEKMIEVMFSSMGRKPSQKQIKETMRQMNRFM